MSKEQDPTKLDTATYRVKHAGLECVVSSPVNIFEIEAHGNVIIFDEPFDDSPVEHATLMVEQRVINGDITHVYSGTLRLNPSFVAENDEEVIDDIVDILVPFEEEADLSDMDIARTGIEGVIRITLEKAVDFLASVNKDQGELLVEFSNFVEVNVFDSTEIVTPYIDKNPKVQLEAFLKLFMELMKKSTNLIDEKDEVNPSFPPTKFIIKAYETDPDKSAELQEAVGELALREKSPIFLSEDVRIALRKPKIKLEQIGGLQNQKDTINEVIVGFTNPNVAQKWKLKPTSGLLLYGPSGTGKSMMVEALGGEIDAKLCFIQSSDIYDMWMGGSEGNMKMFFDAVKTFKAGRLVIAFEEIDSIITGNSGTPTERRVTGVFKQELAELDNPNVLVVATTNHEDDIDPAILRSGRFSHKVYMPMPDSITREGIFLNQMRNFLGGDDFTSFNPFDQGGLGLDFQLLAKKSEGLNGADIVEIFDRTLRKKGLHEALSAEDPGPVTTQDIIDQITDINQQ